MTDKKVERKLRKRARRLARFARRNGIDHVSMYAIGSNEDDARWFCDVTAYRGELRVISRGDFFREEEL